MGLLANDDEWIRCLDDNFLSNFDPLTEVFAVILAFCEPSNPFRIWNESKEKVLADFPIRNTKSFGNGNDFQGDSVAESYVLNEIQNSFR